MSRMMIAGVALALASTPAAGGDVALHVEAGPAWQTRNDFRIPGDGGTRVELAEVDSGPFGSFRGALTWDLTERQSLRLVAAPLTVKYGAEHQQCRGMIGLQPDQEIDGEQE